MRARYLLPLIVVIGLSGCGNWNTLYRQPSFSQSPADSVITDINARLLLAIPNTESRKETTSRIFRNKPSTIVCAEPSPDALTTYAANATVGKNVAEKISINGSAAYNSAGLYVGNRTQTIQLIRDQMYRLCEAYANGIIDSGTYEMMIVRSQRYTIALALLDNIQSLQTTKETSSESATTPNQDQSNKKAGTARKSSTPTTPKQHSNFELSAINALLGRGDENYLCFNLFKSLDDKKPSDENSGIGQAYTFCKNLFTSKNATINQYHQTYNDEPLSKKDGGGPVLYRAPLRLDIQENLPSQF